MSPKKNLKDIKKGLKSLDLKSNEILKKGNVLDLSSTKKSGSKKATLKDLNFDDEFQVAETTNGSWFSKKRKVTLELFTLGVLSILFMFVINTVNIYYTGLDIKDQVVASTFSGYNQLMDVSNVELDSEYLYQFSNIFKEALVDFDQADSLTWFLDPSKSYLFASNKEIDSGRLVIEVGKHISESGLYLSDSINSLIQIPDLIYGENIVDKNSPSTSLTNKIKQDFSKIKFASHEMSQAAQKMQQIDINSVPNEYQVTVAKAQGAIQKIDQELSDMVEFLPPILKLLGDKHPHRYLILLQNSNEIRPTGGFIGSFLLVDINDGFITKMDFEDVYKWDGQLHDHVEPPEEIAKLTGEWRLRDSNYSPSFPISAEKARWFFEKEGGYTVDTVIAVDQTILGDLLALTGPVYIPEADISLDADNFDAVLSTIIENKDNPTNPKDVLEQFIPQFKDALRDKADFKEVFSVLTQAAYNKKIQAYSEETSIQDFFKAFGFSGEINPPEEKEDYLNVINVSIGGNKSDKYIKQTINHGTLLESNGEVINTLKITREHNYSDEIEKAVDELLSKQGINNIPGFVKDILGRGENIVSTKVYVPKGSELIESIGIDKSEVKTKYDEELGLTYFLYESRVLPRQTSEITLRYKLPFKMEFSPVDNYKIKIDKQSGMRNERIIKKIFFGNNLNAYRFLPDEETKFLDENMVIYDQEFINNIYLSGVFGF